VLSIRDRQRPEEGEKQTLPNRSLRYGPVAPHAPKSSVLTEEAWQNPESADDASPTRRTCSPGGQGVAPPQFVRPAPRPMNNSFDGPPGFVTGQLQTRPSQGSVADLGQSRTCSARWTKLWQAKIPQKGARYWRDVIASGHAAGGMLLAVVRKKDGRRAEKNVTWEQRSSGRVEAEVSCPTGRRRPRTARASDLA